MISLSMGERGVATRILASKYGGLLTFGALTAGQESAPGQPTVAELKTFYRCNSHTASTQVCPPSPPTRSRMAGAFCADLAGPPA